MGLAIASKGVRHCSERRVQLMGGGVALLDEARAARRDREEAQPPAHGHRHAEVGQETLRAAVEGDRRAFETIVTVYEPRLRALAYQMLRDRHAVDDVLQDVFLRAYRGLHKFRGDAVLGTWLHRITYTSCLDLIRKRRVVLVPLEAVEADPGLQRPDEDLAVKLSLQRALTTLDAEHLVAVLMVDRDGYDYATVARVLRIPVGTVGSRLNAARLRLRAELQWQDEDAPGVKTERTEEGR
jgi:RNA polymerase sigma-70 factor (ECF subfamily)